MIPRVMRGPLVAPGRYTVSLTAGGQKLTSPLTVLADPHSLGTPTSISAGEGFETQLITEINHVSGMIEHLEWVRKQVASLDMQFQDDSAAKPVVDATKLADEAMTIEGKLIDIHLTNGNEDLNRNRSQL